MRRATALRTPTPPRCPSRWYFHLFVIKTLADRRSSLPDWPRPQTTAARRLLATFRLICIHNRHWTFHISKARNKFHTEKRRTLKLLRLFLLFLPPQIIRNVGDSSAGTWGRWSHSRTSSTFTGGRDLWGNEEPWLKWVDGTSRAVPILSTAGRARSRKSSFHLKTKQCVLFNANFKESAIKEQKQNYNKEVCKRIQSSAEATRPSLAKTWIPICFYLCTCCVTPHLRKPRIRGSNI